MKKVLLLLFVGLSSQLIGQQTSISGVVAVFNSAFETGSREYVSNAQIEDDFKKANATTTGADGRFKLIFVGTKDNEKVSFNVKKERLEIVNTEALYAVAGQKEQVAVFMSPEGKVAENKLKYYQINREAAEKALTSKLKTIGDEILKLKQNERANAGQIEKLQTEYGFLQKQYEKIDQSARGMAERYAKINLDDQTKEYQTAFRYFQKGQLEEALKILNQVDLEKTGSSIVQEQERNRKIDKEWMERDSIKNEKKRQVTEALGFKADLHKTQFEFVKVEETYQLLLRLDSTNIYSLWAYAYFLAEQNKNYEATAYYERALALAQTLELIATFQNNLGLLYRANQKMPQAEGAYNEALKIYRQLADNNPDAFLPGLANILNNLGNYYRANQKMSQAEGAYNEALIIKRQLADKNPDTFLPELSNTLNDLGLYYYTNQKMPQAEVIFNEALKIRRQLADNNPDAFLPDIATTLNNLGAYYYANQKMPQAEGAYNEALKIKRQLADKNPDAFLPDVAGTLNNMGVLYYVNQEMSQAEGAYNEALKIFRQLAEKNPDAFLPDLAETLNNLGAYFYANQKTPQAEAAYNEALNIRRQLADKNPNASLPDLAMTLNNLGEYYRVNQKMPVAEAAFNEALKIYRQLAENNPEAFLPDVAMTLNNLGLFYSDNQQMPQAEGVYKEALKIRRQLAGKNPDAFLPDLAMTLTNLGSYYNKNLKMPRAKAAFSEALKIYRQLAAKNPDAFLPYLAGTLNNLGIFYRNNQKMPQAEASYKEALTIKRQLAGKNPEAFLPDVAITLNNLGNYYRDNQKMPQAEEAYNEALKIRRQLTDKNPDAFLPDLAGTLNNLGLFYKTLKNYDKALDHYGEAFSYREGAILKGGTHFFNDWVKVLFNIAEMRDSAEVKKDYAGVVKAGQLLAEGCDSMKGVDEKLIPIAVSEYGSLSWWALFTKDYTLSEKAAQRCLELDNTQEWVLTNLGHSQLLRGQYAAAKASYEKLKGKKDNEGKDYKQVILDDLKALEAEGITHKDFAQARASIEKW